MLFQNNSIEEKTIFKWKKKHKLRVKSSNPRVNFRYLARIELTPHTKVLKNHFYNTAFKNLCVINILPTYFSIGHKVRIYSPSMDLTCRGDGFILQEVPTWVHQREEVNWVSQLKPSGQQIFSTMSRPESKLVRQD